MVETVCENRPIGLVLVPLNIRCSRKCARPDLPAVSSADPTRYHTMWVTTGARWSGMTTTSRPLLSLKWETSRPAAAAAPAASVAMASVAASAADRSNASQARAAECVDSSCIQGLMVGGRSARCLRPDTHGRPAFRAGSRCGAKQFRGQDYWPSHADVAYRQIFRLLRLAEIEL